MKMTDKQLAEFKADSGACSIVTAREAGHDKSVTLDKYEVEILATCIPLDSITRKGGGAPDGKPPKHPFFVDGTLVELAVKYPKLKKTELRLYMSRANKFYGTEGDTFYIYTRKGYTHVGFA